MTDSPDLKPTPLHAAHKLLGARMCPFAGYDMPVQYPDGVLAEHRWTRAHAGLFDVSHMGPALVSLVDHPGDTERAHAAIAALIEPLISGDIEGLAPGALRYSLLLNPDGGIADDLFVGRPVASAEQGSLYIVVNAATKEADFARIAAAIAGKAVLTRLDGEGLLALQGPEAQAVMAGLAPAALELGFMRWRRFEIAGRSMVVSRSGYTGEDGFEILVPRDAAEPLWLSLLEDERVRPVGLGARDSLRLEAGLPLYGHDIDESTSPVEAGLAFAVSKRRLAQGSIAGGERMRRELGGELARVRVGVQVLEGPPARDGAEIVHGGEVVGRVTSGGFSPSLSAPIAMAYLPPDLAAPGTAVEVVVRGRRGPARVAALPFVPHRYVRHT